MKKFKYAAYITLLSIVMNGCGGGSSSISSSIPTDITIERGPVIGSYVVDDNGIRGYNLGLGQYRFYKEPAYPIKAFGGYIDVNRDGIIDANDTKLTIDLSLSQIGENKLTILTTLAEDSVIRDYIINTYGITESELFTLVPSTSLVVSAISDEVFKYCIENNISMEDLNLTTLQSLEVDTLTLISTHEASTDTLINIVTNNEIALVNDLNISLVDENLTAITNEITISSAIQTRDISSVLDLYPTYDLNQTQIDDLKFMYQEEKVARDIYMKMYELWNLNIFNNISKAEQMHMDSVRAILVKYNIDIPVLSDTVGVFDLSDLQTLYNNLLASGQVSSTEALKVGKLIEETDISDLNAKILIAPDDIKAIYEKLLNGSYNHLNAFTSKL